MARPAKWDDPEAFEAKVDEYFSLDIRHSWTGLAIHLGFESRQSLEDYKKKEGFSYPIKKALLQIEKIYEDGLFGKNPAGSIFALKNFGWKDKHEYESNSVVRVLTVANVRDYKYPLSSSNNGSAGIPESLPGGIQDNSESRRN